LVAHGQRPALGAGDAAGARFHADLPGLVEQHARLIRASHRIVSIRAQV